jgi:hypothetical protein
MGTGGYSTIKHLATMSRGNGAAVRPIYVGGDWVATDDEVAVASPADSATPFLPEATSREMKAGQ